MEIEGKEIIVRPIEYQSLEYQQACQLRYRLFYAEHNLPWNTVFDRSEANCFHYCIAIKKNLVAYGQLCDRHNRVYQVKQMVVAPKYQKQGLGQRILLSLINLARQQDGTEIVLNARLTATGFYQKLGFKMCGVEFPSSTTGVVHVPMNKKL